MDGRRLSRLFTNLLIMILAVFMVLIVCRFIFIVPLDHISFYETTLGLEIDPYYDETDNIYYLILPAYASVKTIEIKSPGFVNVSFSDDSEDFGSDISNLPVSENVQLNITSFFQKESYTFQILQCENLQTVYVETESGSIDYVNESKENEENASVLIINDDATVEFEGLSTITGRGNSTWGGAKKPYNLKFDQMTDIMGLGSAKTWCLIASYIDPSQIRNTLSYYAAREIGIEYTSKTELVSLFINGKYFGLYTLATKQNYLEDTDSSVAAVFDIRSGDESYDYSTHNGTHIRFRYGDSPYIESIIEDFEDALNQGADFNFISKYIDVESFAKKYCLETVLLNGDNQKSQYFAVSPDGKISAICAWDYDHAFGISYRRYYDNSYNSFYISVKWYNKLFEYDEFKQAVISTFIQYEEFFENTLISFMNQTCLRIANDWEINSIRWRNEEQLSESIYKLKCDPVYLESLEGQQIYITTFIKKRTEFLSEYWSNPDQFCILTFSDSTIGTVSVYCKREHLLTDDMIPDGLLSIPLDGFLGWRTQNGDSLTDVGVVADDMVFYGTWEANDTISDTEKTNDSAIAFIKRIYDGVLNSFGVIRLSICGIFGLILLVLISREIINGIRKRGNKN